MVDVFTILPRVESGAKGGRGDGYRPETPDNSNDGYKPSPISLKQYKIEEEEILPQEVAYKSVRKLPKDHGSDNTTDEEMNWAAAKAVMG